MIAVEMAKTPIQMIDFWGVQRLGCFWRNGWCNGCNGAGGIIVSGRKPPPAVGDLPEEVQATITEAMPLYEEQLTKKCLLSLIHI